MNEGEQQRSLSRIAVAIDDGKYKIDLELLDRYTNFSGEIVRLALAVLTGIGFLISIFAKNGPNPTAILDVASNRCTLGGGVACLCASVGFALAHRYFACDGFADQAAALRLLPDKPAELVDRKAASARFRNGVRLYKMSARFLAAAAVFLCVGLVLVSLGIAASLVHV